MKKTTILFIHHGTGIGGALISMLNVVKRLNKDKYNIKVACLKGGDHIDILRNEGIETDIIGASTRYFYHNETGNIQWYFFPYYIVVFFVWLYTAYYVAPKYLKKQKFDLIHLNSHVLTSWAFAAHKLGSRVILHNRETITRGYFGIRYRILKNLIKDNCNHIINISQDNKDRLGLIKNSSVVYNFIEIPIEYKQPMNDDRKIKKVLFLGGMASIKGFDVTVECLDYLNENIEVNFAGYINKEITFRNFIDVIRDKITQNSTKIKKIAGSPNAKIIGVLKNPYEYIDDCDILITPFKISHFSRPAIEAFAYGKPVIGSDVVGMSEIIDHNVNGLIFESTNPLSLANSINYLCGNPNIAKQMGRKGRQKAIDIFSPEANISKVERIYAKVLNS